MDSLCVVLLISLHTLAAYTYGGIANRSSTRTNAVVSVWESPNHTCFNGFHYNFWNYGDEEIGPSQVYPEGLREQLNWLNATYDVKEIVITENGVPSLDAGLVDTQRMEYYRDYLEQVRQKYRCI